MQLTVVVELIVVTELVFESRDDVGMIEVHVLDAAREVLVDDEAVFDVRNSSDVEVPVEVQLHEVAVNAIANPDSVDRHDDVATFSGNHDFVKGVVVQQGSQCHGGFKLAAEVDVEEQSVFH